MEGATFSLLAGRRTVVDYLSTATAAARVAASLFPVTLAADSCWCKYPVLQGPACGVRG